MFAINGWVWLTLVGTAQVDPPVGTASGWSAVEAVSSVQARQEKTGDDAGRESAAESAMETFPMPAHTAFRRVVVGTDGSVTETPDDNGGVAREGERLIFSNTLGINAVAIGNGLLLADDITTTAPVGCNLKRFRFKVLGKVNSAGAGGPYTVRYALYAICPQSVSNEFRQRDVGDPAGGIRIPGTSGELTFPDDAPRLIEVAIAEPNVVPIPTNVWLGLQFLRSNCGTVVGAPAMLGHSADNWDFGGAVPCLGWLGGFPDQPHASIWADVSGDANCPETFVAYRADKANGTVLNAGPSLVLLDDLRLSTSNCRMVGLEVAVRGAGLYYFELRRDCSGPAIPGTAKVFLLSPVTRPAIQLARFTIDPPVELGSSDVFFAFRSSTPAAGLVNAGVQATLGSSSENYLEIRDGGLCSVVSPQPGQAQAVFHVSITCAGPQPSGACCDPYLTECVGGPDAGQRCRCNAVCVGGANDGSCCSPSTPCASPGVCTPQCAAPGSCEAVCREVPQMNCLFPPRGQDLVPKWAQGAVCEPDPFGFTPCGNFACCHTRINPVTQREEDVCTNLTKNQCEALPPLDKPRLWQLGLKCGSGPQECVRRGCIHQVGSCVVEHATPGCADRECCNKVCTLFGSDGEWCCNVEWDRLCVELALIACPVPLHNDECASDNADNTGATTIPVPGSVITDTRGSTNNPSEPGFCCHGGVANCVGGTNAGKPCAVQTDCPGGTCPAISPMPGEKGTGSVWLKFVQPQAFTSAAIDTCTSNSPARDSILQVFAARDRSSEAAACESLVPIGCDDDTPCCGFDGRNSRLCMQGLTPGETYYIMVSAKTSQTMGPYRVTVTAGCIDDSVPSNDYCMRSAVVSDGSTPFDLTRATFDCPAEPCVPDARNDLWFDYTATCSGIARFDTCGASSGTSPNTNLVVYEGCDRCPPDEASVLGCNGDAFLGCGLASRVSVDVTEGHCYRIRLADQGGFPVYGSLNVSCEPTGACCDWVNTDANGEAVCRDVPLSECPSRPNGDPPHWIEGVSCESNPFDPPCGKAACCHFRSSSVTGYFFEACANLTKSECDAAHPVDRARAWQPGQHCGRGGQFCPRLACLESTESCAVEHYSPGCRDYECCESVCRSMAATLADYCCQVEWDIVCAEEAQMTCGLPPPNDHCSPGSTPDDRGATLIRVPGGRQTISKNATVDLGDPGFCCHGGVSNCVGGVNAGLPCAVASDCPEGSCPTLTPMPGERGYGTVWFKFVLPLGQTSAMISTCNNYSSARDSILQVFMVRDHSSEAAACRSLVTIGCNDDALGCGPNNRHSRLCVQGLQPGQVYYIMLATKTPQALGVDHVTVTAGCVDAGLPDACDPYCPAGPIVFVDPPSDVVDARAMLIPEIVTGREGIRSIVVAGPVGISKECWMLCDSKESGMPNAIESVMESPLGIYSIQLSRPITPGATTTIAYTNWAGQTSSGRFTFHPGDVNGDGVSAPADLLDLIDVLNGVAQPRWGLYSTDCDHSGEAGPADILCVIDLLNAGWNGTTLPPGTRHCP